MEKARRVSEKHLFLLYWLCQIKPLTVWITINCGKFWRRWEYQTTWLASWETCMQSEKISQSKDRYFRRDRLRINWEYDLTWERVMPDLFSFMFLLFWASPSGNTNLQGISKRWKTWCLMLRVNTLPSWAPAPHTGKPSPRGADSPLGPLSQEDSGP